MRLGEICQKIGSGATPTGGKNSYADSGISLIRSQNVLDFAFSYNGLAHINEEQADKLRNVNVLPDDVLLNITGDSVARVCMVDEAALPARVNQHVAIVRVDKTLADPYYVMLWLVWQKNRLLSLASNGATRHALTKEMIQELDLSLPSLNAQTRVSRLLHSLDRKIALNRRKIATLEKMAKEIYDYWFVQYDFPDANGRPYKSSGGEMVYSPELKREIPKGWRSSSLGEIMQIERKTVDPSSIPDQVIVHYSIPAFDENMYPAFCCASEIQSSKFKIDSEVVLLSKLNPKFKRIWDPPVIGEYSLCSTEFIVCNAKQPRDKPFIFEVLNSDSVQRYMIDGASSSTGSRSRFAAELLPDFPLAIPPQSVIDSFTRIAKLSHTQIKKLRIDITRLTTLRDFLLPLLMNGQARIGGVA